VIQRYAIALAANARTIFVVALDKVDYVLVLVGVPIIV
jgi:hypothetical protein